MNYFEFYDIPISFLVDEAALKKQFYANSKKYHPDFHTLESEEKQAEILELSTLNNTAYKTLLNFDKRMQYVLQLMNALEEEGQNKIPQAFLMEMMDLNENLMELEFDYDPAKHQQIQAELAQLEGQLKETVQPQLENFDPKESDSVELSAIKDYYLKKRYLLRIRENLSKFASR